MNPSSDSPRPEALGSTDLGANAELERLIPTNRRNHSVLLGFFEEQDARQFLQGKVERPEQLAEIMQRWSHARARIRTLEAYTGEPETRPILDPEPLLEIEKVMARPECQNAFPAGSWTVSLVELSKIIPYQPSVDTGYAIRDGEAGHSPEDLLSAVRLCFPCAKNSALAISTDQGQKAITVSGVNPALTVVGMQYGQHQQLGMFVVSFFISAGPNVVQVSRYRGRYLLSNGYHRAYRLLKAGFTHIPCLIRNAANFAETGAAGQGFFSESVLMSDRPPLFADFADEILAIGVPVHEVKKVIRIRPDEFLAVG